MKAYKVVREYEDHYRSAIRRVDFAHGKYDLTYKLGEKTVPPGNTKIFVFDSFLRASDFASGCYRDSTRIVEGKAENAKAFYHVSQNSGYIAKFWTLKAYDRSWSTSHAPTGTFIADSFTPTAVLR